MCQFYLQGKFSYLVRHFDCQAVILSFNSHFGWQLSCHFRALPWLCIFKSMHPPTYFLLYFVKNNSSFSASGVYSSLEGRGIFFINYNEVGSLTGIIYFCMMYLLKKTHELKDSRIPLRKRQYHPLDTVYGYLRPVVYKYFSAI